MKKKKGLVPLALVTVLSLGSCLAVILADFTPNLGLDLQGGVSVVLQPVKAGKKQTKVSQEALEQTQRVIETRVNAIGVGEPDITIQGTTIVVQLPGIKDQKRVLDLVGKTAELRFRPVLAAPTAAPPKDADEQIAALREELKIPEGVTVQQIVDEENAAATAADPTVTDPTATTVPTDPTATTAVDPAATTVAPTTAAPTTTTAASGAGSGGKSSMKGAAARRQSTTTTAAEAATTTTAAPTATTTTAPGTVTTTTVYVPKNQWGIDVTDPNFAKLYQLDQAVNNDAEKATAPADDKADAEVVLLGQPDTDGTRVKYKLGPTLLTGRAIETASAGLANGKWVVNPVYKDGKDGIDLFNKAAALCNAGAPECPGIASGEGGAQVGQLAVVLDGEVISAPAINAASFSRDQIQISGSFTEQSSKDLALALRYGSLPLELEPQTVQTVSATLGSGALRSGIIAGLIGLGVVVLYVIAYYRLLGAITVGSLILTAALLWAVVGLLGHYSGLALSLAGIVGIIVSIGVSLDSSVVYFENLKEDVMHGRTLRSAVDRSFDQAWGTIIKADVSSLIGAIILYVLSVGPVKGFAFYLALSTVIDLVLAYMFIRPATVLAARSKLGLRPALFGIPMPATTPAGAGGATGRSARTDASTRAAAGSKPVATGAIVADEPEVEPEPEPEPEVAPESEIEAVEAATDAEPDASEPDAGEVVATDDDPTNEGGER